MMEGDWLNKRDIPHRKARGKVRGQGSAITDKKTFTVENGTEIMRQRKEDRKCIWEFIM